MKHFLYSEMANTAPEQALFHLIPAPLEASVSYGGGTAGGPEAILEASGQLETWDGLSSPFEEGIYTAEAVTGNTAEEVVAGIRKQTNRVLGMQKIPVLLGGEHTVSLGAAQAVFDCFGTRVGLVQIDAHADLRDNYEGNPYSHASVIRKIHELSGWKIYQLGIRAWCEEEYLYQKEKGIYCLTGREASSKQIRTLSLPADFPEFLYITIDIDGLDSSLVPATGTPVPGGLSWYQTLDLLESVIGQRQVVGFDCVELAPQKHLGFCDFTAAQLIYNVMGMIQRSRRGRT